MRSSVEASRGEAPSLELPVGVGHGDLAPIAGDEVPPHEDLLVEGPAAEQEHTGTVGRGRAQRPQAPFRRRRAGWAMPRCPRCRGAPWRTKIPCSNVGSRGRCTIPPPAMSTPTSGESTGAGERAASNVPIRTVARAVPRSTTGSTEWWANDAGSWRVASGWATQSCTPSRTPPAWPRESSAWTTPAPAVIRFSWAGRIGCWVPRLSECSTCPARSQVTVCSPMCGWGPTVMVRCGRHVDRAEAVEEAPRPHHAPSPLGQGTVHRQTSDLGEVALEDRRARCPPSRPPSAHPPSAPPSVTRRARARGRSWWSWR